MLYLSSAPLSFSPQFSSTVFVSIYNEPLDVAGVLSEYYKYFLVYSLQSSVQVGGVGGVPTATTTGSTTTTSSSSTESPSSPAASTTTTTTSSSSETTTTPSSTAGGTTTTSTTPGTGTIPGMAPLGPGADFNQLMAQMLATMGGGMGGMAGMGMPGMGGAPAQVRHFTKPTLWSRVRICFKIL